jgi:hypothetical protein
MIASKSIGNNYDIYQQFIKHLKNLEKQLIKKSDLQLKKFETLPSLQKTFVSSTHKECYGEKLNLEKHHIIPFHNGGLKSGPVILCTPENHVLAHYYRYLAYRQKGDLIAFTMRQNQKISSRARALLGVEVHKKNKTGFFSSTWQAKQGKKGGKKTGRNNGVLARQGKIMRKTLKRTTYWECFDPISNLKSQKNSQIKLKKAALIFGCYATKIQKKCFLLLFL